MPVRRSEPHRLEAAHGDSRGLRQKHQGLGVGARPCPSTLAGEEAARLWVQQLRPAVIRSHLPINWLPCWVTQGGCPG